MPILAGNKQFMSISRNNLSLAKAFIFTNSLVVLNIQREVEEDKVLAAAASHVILSERKRKREDINFEKE